VKDHVESANCKLCKNLQNQQHCLQRLLPQIKPQTHKLRRKRHTRSPPPIIEQNVPLFHISYSNTVNLSCMLFSRGINTKHTKRISYSFCVFCVYLSVFCMTVLVCNHICIVRLSQVFKIKVELKVEVESFAFCVTVRDRKTLGSFEFRSKHGGLSPEHAWEHRPRAQDGFSYLETSIRDCPNDVIRVWLS